MNLRRIASLTGFFAFCGVLLTSIVLFVEPHGRVAYWANWRLLGLSKAQWGALHVNLGVLLIISVVIHTCYNWKSILAYLKDRFEPRLRISKDGIASFLLAAAFVAGTYFQLVPFSTIVSVSEAFKDRATRIYGEPPYGHAELSTLEDFARKMQIDLPQGVELLRIAGFQDVDAGQTLEEIARSQGVPPQTVYQVIWPAAAAEGVRELPETAPPGTGNLTLAELSRRYGFDLRWMLDRLAAENVSVEPEMTLKKVSQQNRTSPIAVYDKIKTLVKAEESRP